MATLLKSAIQPDSSVVLGQLRFRFVGRLHGGARHSLARQAYENRSCRKSRGVGQDVAAGLWRFRDFRVGDGALAHAGGALAGGFERPFAPPHRLRGAGVDLREPYSAPHRAFCGKRLRGRQ
jgi:hypothetical protein